MINLLHLQPHPQVCGFPLAMTTVGLGVVTVHTCVDRVVGAEGQPAGLSGTCLPPCVPLKDTEAVGVQRSRSVSISRHCNFEQ